MTELKDLTHMACVAQQQAVRSPSDKQRIRDFLPELIQLERLLAEAPAPVSAAVQQQVQVADLSLPVYRICVGRAPSESPLLLLTAGVHGLERIGTRVLLAWLEGLFGRLRWDEHLAAQLQTVQLVVVPLVNPGGMFLNRRSNPAGVDLMRNAPINAQHASTFLLGGQQFSSRLPWYRGTPEQGMEPESLALKRLMEEWLPGRPFTLSLDCHSGFGWRDQIWFPYAYRRRPMHRIDSVFALKLLWEQACPAHDYVMEPQSRHYLTHGDLWDYFYKCHNRDHEGTFIPLTLEMGSWRWVRKRPRQLLRLEGLFNPLVPHRLQRVLRSHQLLLNFLLDATASYHRWLPEGDEARVLREAARLHFYPKPGRH